MRFDSDPHLTIAAPPHAAEAFADLRSYVDEFLSLEESEASTAELYHRVVSDVYGMCAAIVAAEEAGTSREAILEVLGPVRRIHRDSPFVQRLQDWPRGYPGDFETVEHLWTGENRAEADTLASLCEQYALSRPIAQQHRNKVHEQAAHVVRTLLEHPRTARILSIACGGCPDLRLVAEYLGRFAGEIWLNDTDAGALEFSARALDAVRDRCHFRPGNALKFVRKAEAEGLKFDLLLAGGLFDYLPDKQAAYLIEHAAALVAPGGTFFFTNIAHGNPYRPLIEYLGDWFLIERSEDDVMRLCDAAGVARDNIRIRRDATGLALLVDVSR